MYVNVRVDIFPVYLYLRLYFVQVFKSSILWPLLNLSLPDLSGRGVILLSEATDQHLAYDLILYMFFD